MTPVGEKPYLEQCIAALPAEKREAARRAFYEISETGDDSYLSKLLAVLEANGAYARKVPKEMTEAGAQVVREMESMARQIVEFEKYRRDAFQRTITDEAERLADSLPVREINAGIDRQNVLLDHLQKVADKIDKGVSTGVFSFFALLSFAAGVALTVWFFEGALTETQDAKSFCDALANAGIHVEIKPTENGSHVTLTGPGVKETASLYSQGTPCGVAVDFIKPQ